MNEQRALPNLSPQDRKRYARHLVLPQLGETGQRRLKAARVLLVGIGGLGSAIAQYMAGVGVGCIGLVDDDVVSLSNLQRQVLHGTAWINRPKVDSAAQRIADLNPDITVVTHNARFTRATGEDIASNYDLILDGTDNFQARYDINAICLQLGIPYIYGAIFQWNGQASVLCTPGGPCYRCVFPNPPAEPVPTGEQAGILGAIPGTIGTIQATEAIKWLTHAGSLLVGRLLLYDGSDMRFESIEIAKAQNCPDCGHASHS